MNNNFCVMPFFGGEYDKSGFITPCCLMKPHKIDEVRSQMLNNIRPECCKSCWDLEDQSIKSDRQLKNETFDFYENRDINFIFQDCCQGKYSPKIIKLYTSNLCNATCITCGPTASTSWAKLKSIPINLVTMGDDSLNKINFSTITSLSLLGGEPLYDKNILIILQQLLDKNNTSCFISIVTNGSTELTQKHIDILSQFKNLSICVSIDGIGPVFEYLRYPLKWSVLINNIKLFKEFATYVSVSYTISNLNILYYHDTIGWFNQNNLTFNTNIVSHPSYFNVNSLPQSIKDQHPELNQFFRPHLPIDDQNFMLAIKEINAQDQLKGLTGANFIPRFTNIIL